MTTGSIPIAFTAAPPGASGSFPTRIDGRNDDTGTGDAR
jgi:hypothetical protein